MKRVRLFFAIIFSMTSFFTISAVYAAPPPIVAGGCSPTATTHDDNITCTNDNNNVNNSVNGGPGSDTITLNGKTGTNANPATVSGGTGDDSITNSNNSTLHGSIDGGQGNDTITNNGTITIPTCGCTTDAINGGANDDTIVNNGKTNGDVSGGNGADSITNNGKINGDIRGGNGNDTIVNNGTVQSVFGGDDTGQDTYVNNGTVTGSIQAHLGSNTITNNGDVKGNINLGNCDGCDNIVVLTGNATVGGTVQGDKSKKLNSGTRTLVFNLTVSNSQINDLANQIVNADHAGGTITINGQVYKWSNLTGLIALLHAAAASGSFGDGRINPNDLQQTITGWCRLDSSLDIWAVNNGKGQGLFLVTSAQIAAALKQAVSSGHNVLIKEQAGRQLWALSSNQLQIHDARGGTKYDFIFASNTCGKLPTS